MKDERLFDCVGISGCTRGNVCDLDGRCGYAPDPTLSQGAEPLRYLHFNCDRAIAEGRFGDACEGCRNGTNAKQTTKEPEVWTATLTGPDGHSESICTRYPDVLLKWLIAHSERLGTMVAMATVPDVPGTVAMSTAKIADCVGEGDCPAAGICLVEQRCRKAAPTSG